MLEEHSKSARMRKMVDNKRVVFNKSDYDIVMQLYYLNKTHLHDEPRLPKNDFRRRARPKEALKLSGTGLASLRRMVGRIAALW
jgi:hypothetical protein